MPKEKNTFLFRGHSNVEVAGHGRSLEWHMSWRLGWCDVGVLCHVHV